MVLWCELNRPFWPTGDASWEATAEPRVNQGGSGPQAARSCLAQTADTSAAFTSQPIELVGARREGVPGLHQDTFLFLSQRSC